MNSLSISNNNTTKTELSQFSSNPYIQEMAARHLKNQGSLAGIYNSVYGNSSSSNSRSNSSSTSNAPSVGSNGKYMIHYYYGCQPGNKITTVIG